MSHFEPPPYLQMTEEQKKFTKLQKNVAEKCCRLVELCSIQTEVIADPATANSLFVKVAMMSRDQLLKTYGLFDPNFGTSMFAHEKILWQGLMSRVLALDKMIDSMTLFESDGESIVQHKQHVHLKQLRQQCHMLACVIEFHLTAWMIEKDASSKNGTPVESIDVYCACGSCNGTVKSHAYDALIPAWSHMTAVKVCEDIQLFIEQSFTTQPCASQSTPL